MTDEPQSGTTDQSNETRLDKFVEEHPKVTDAIDNFLIPGFDEKLNTVLSDLDRESAADQTMLAEFAKLPDAEAPGADVKALSDADKTFNDHEVVSVARDCYLILQKARTYEQPDLGEAELSPDLEAQLRAAIGRDVAEHHRHLLPDLEIDDARIVKAQLVDGKEVVTVRLWLLGEQIERDEATSQIVEGSPEDVKWQEDWTLTRDPRVEDIKGENESLTLSGQWFVAHKGWVVTKIQRVSDPQSQPPPLLE